MDLVRYLGLDYEVPELIVSQVCKMKNRPYSDFNNFIFLQALAISIECPYRLKHSLYFLSNKLIQNIYSRG
jgi:hypothetical protein